MKVGHSIQNRNIGVDLLRGFSILLVILLHFNIHFGLKNSFISELLPAKLFSFLFWNGMYGVVIFFTLSGYLITSSILKKYGTLSAINLKQFYWFRFARIIPPLLILLLVLSFLHIFEVPGFVINPNKSTLLRALFAALTFHINWLEIQVGYLPASWDVLWSISIEECFYIVFPITCLFLKKDWKFSFVLLALLFVSVWGRTQLFPDNALAYKNHLAYLDSIAFGCMTAILAHRFKLSKKLNLLFLIIGWVLIILVMFYKGLIWRSGITEAGLNVTMLSLGVSLVLFWMSRQAKEGLQKDRWGLRWLRKMGTYSYEIYLTHMFIIIPGASMYHKLELGPNWIIPLCLAAVFLSAVLGWFLSKTFSEPVNNWLRGKG